MNQLMEGIKIVCSDSDINLKDRLFLSSGTEPASVSTDCGSTPYCNNALVPRLPWRSLTSMEQQILFNTKLEKLESLYVSILNIPQNILDCLKELNKLEDRRFLKDILQTERVKKGVALIHEYIETFRMQSAELSEYRIDWNEPKQMTVTVDSERCRVGLHIDNQRGSSLHRISINLGSEPRYFLFINLSIDQLYRLIFETDGNAVSIISGRSRICMAFMQLFPNYPVVKLRVNPGEAYIAPTEHITHDGCTEGTHNLDVFFTLRSIFS
ncbi:hypothetical protein QUA56_02880 [Microcoleus sp. N3A4]|uniref:hypothetical protein n=1 Tax=Microcoleus sp. N3A4 TaxID=3055379 RepID=UPI002FD004B3